MRRICLVLLVLMLVGCGREIPEGYAPVMVRFDSSQKTSTLFDSFSLGPSFKALTQYGGCPGDKITLVVRDDFGMPEIREFLGDRINVDINFDPAPVFERKLLVPKGPGKIIMVSGQLGDVGLCSSGTNQHLVGGFWKGDVFGPLSINIVAVMSTNDLSAGAGALDGGVWAGSPFVALKITNDTLTSALTIIVKNLSEDTPRSVRPLSLAAGASSGIAPLMPFRKYRISLSTQSVSPTTVFASKEYVTRGPAEKLQEVVIPAVPVAAVP